jgi:hypothetical protein
MGKGAERNRLLGGGGVGEGSEVACECGSECGSECGWEREEVEEDREEELLRRLRGLDISLFSFFFLRFRGGCVFLSLFFFERDRWVETRREERRGGRVRGSVGERWMDWFVFWKNNI